MLHSDRRVKMLLRDVKTICVNVISDTVARQRVPNVQINPGLGSFGQQGGK